MGRFRPLYIVLLWIWLLGLSLTALAQTSGQLSGTVNDSQGAPASTFTVQLFLAGGGTPVAETRTDAQGRFHLANLRPEFYDVVATGPGHSPGTIRGVKVDPALETVLSPIVLKTGQFSQSTGVVDPRQQLPATPPISSTIVVEEQFRLGLGSSTQPLQAGDRENDAQIESTEVSNTMTRTQVSGLPVLERDPMALLRTQAGVDLVALINPLSSGVVTVVNGQRASWANMTLDGVNIQQNYERRNPLTSEFNRWFLGQVSEFTAVTSNANSTLSGGSSQIVFVTPSGTNQVHGSLYWYNRNNALAANNWIDNVKGLKQQAFRQNQYGASIGGPLRKDKLLLYANFEGLRRSQNYFTTRILPGADIRNGVFTYIDNNGTDRKVNLLALTGLPVHPEVQKMLAALPPPNKINDLRNGDSFNVLYNTGGYNFPLRQDLTRASILGKVDYIPTSHHAVSATLNVHTDKRDNPAGYSGGFSSTPATGVETPRTFASAAWRWNPTWNFTNELRAGMNLARVNLTTTERYGEYWLRLPTVSWLGDSALFSNPVNLTSAERRNENAFNLQNNAALNRGRHNLQFGFQYQRLAIRRYEEEGEQPELHLGVRTGLLTAQQLPGIDAEQLETANLWASTLAGQVSSVSGTHYITSRDSGYVRGVPWTRNLTMPQTSGYVFDNWKFNPRLTLTLGLRYDLYGVVNEKDSLALQPKVVNNDPVRSLLSDVILDYAGNSAGRPWYPKDLNNFSPQLGVAWDLSGTGRTVLRGGFGLYYVNDDDIRAAEAALEYNPGLFNNYSLPLPNAPLISSSLIPTAAPLRTPFPLSDYSTAGGDSYTGIGLIDPKLRTPFVKQWHVAIQQRIKGVLAEIRYVGNRNTNGYRATDLNQIDYRAGGFLEDFRRALANGRIAEARTGVFNPQYNSALTGSQPLTVFPTITRAGSLETQLVRDTIKRGEVAELAGIYQFLGLSPIAFQANPYAPAGAFLLSNTASSSYDALQMEVRGRTRGGIQLQANYTFGKALSNSEGLSSTRFDPLLDNRNPQIEKSRAPYDIRQSIKANAVYELRLDRLTKVERPLFRRLLEGWVISGLLTSNSGTPFSILSGRGSVNLSGYLTGLAGRSDVNTASTALTGDQLSSIVRFHMTGYGPSVIADSVLAPDGRGAKEAGDAPFAGQVFFNPEPGSPGSVQRRYFSGPWIVNLDASIIKSTRLFGRHVIEIRAEARNAPNHPNFVVRDQNINDNFFGYRTSTLGNNERHIQFGLFYRF